MRIRKAILKSTLRIINLLTIQTECYHDVPCMICRELFCRFIVDNNLLHRTVHTVVWLSCRRIGVALLVEWQPVHIDRM